MNCKALSDPVFFFDEGLIDGTFDGNQRASGNGGIGKLERKAEAEAESGKRKAERVGIAYLPAHAHGVW